MKLPSKYQNGHFFLCNIDITSGSGFTKVKLQSLIYDYYKRPVGVAGVYGKGYLGVSFFRLLGLLGFAGV